MQWSNEKYAIQRQTDQTKKVYERSLVEGCGGRRGCKFVEDGKMVRDEKQKFK
jgi:hypothetical protein